MGWLSRVTGCVSLLALSTQANAGARIAYPSSSQMYALLAGDVQVTFGTVQPKAPIDDGATPQPSPPPPPQPQPQNVAADMPILLPARRSFPLAETSFAPSVRDYVMVTPDGAAPPPALDMRANSFWNIRQDVFPEEQRIRMRSPMDAMLTFSIGGSSPRGSLSIDGGVAGALWTMSQRQYTR
jgi:hypothetical protein